MSSRIQSFINQFNDLFHGTPWLDETFSKKLDPVSESQAFTSSPNNNHSTAEVVSHIIEWRKEIFRRLKDNSPESRLTDDSAANWKTNDTLKQIGWKELRSELEQSHQELVTFLAGKNDEFLDETLAGTEQTKEYYIAGLLHHDVYHLGQIGLILKWAAPAH